MNTKSRYLPETQQTKPETKVEYQLPKGSILINGKKYTIKPLPAISRGLPLWESNIKKLLPSLGSILDRFQHSEFDGSPTTFTEAMLNLSNNLDGTVLMNLSFELFEGATVDGEEFNPDEEFSGNYGAWRQLLSFALTENYGSFFPEGWAATTVSMVMGLLNKDQYEESGDQELTD